MNSYDTTNQNKWREAILNNIMIYPNEMVSRFIGKNFKNSKNENKNAIDIGFGSGRNARVLLDYGFNTYGIDYVEECRDTALKILGDYSNLKELVVADFTEYNWNISFDVALCVGVIFLRGEEDIKRDLTKLYNIMNKGSKVLINFRNKEDHLYGQGKRISENTFLLNKPPYENYLYTFYSKEEGSSLLESIGWQIDNIEREDYYKSSKFGEEKHSWNFYEISKK